MLELKVHRPDWSDYYSSEGVTNRSVITAWTYCGGYLAYTVEFRYSIIGIYPAGYEKKSDIS